MACGYGAARRVTRGRESSTAYRRSNWHTADQTLVQPPGSRVTAKNPLYPLYRFNFGLRFGERSVGVAHCECCPSPIVCEEYLRCFLTQILRASAPLK
jgi:hypothetical protein